MTECFGYFSLFPHSERNMRAAAEPFSFLSVINPIVDFHFMDKSFKTYFKISSFVFHRKK